MEVWVWFGVLDELAVGINVKTSFRNCYGRYLFLSLQKITLRHAKSVNMSAVEDKYKKVANLVLANDISTTAKSPNVEEIRVEQQTVMPQRSESFALSVSTAPGKQIIELKSLARGREQEMFSTGRKSPSSRTLESISMESFKKEQTHVPKKVVIAHGAESPTL